MIDPDAIPVKPVSWHLIDAVLQAHPLPAVPVFQGQALTAELVHDGSWPSKEQRKAARRLWGQYEDVLAGAMVARNRSIYRLFMARGVELEVPPVEEWGGDLPDLGIDLQSVGAPTLKVLYIDQLLSPQEQVDLLVRIMQATNPAGVGMTGVRRMFQEAIEQ